MSGLGSWLGLGLGSVLVLGLIILGTLSRYYCAHSITPCFNRSVGTITTAYSEPSDYRTFSFGLENLFFLTYEPSD